MPPQPEFASILNLLDRGTSADRLKWQESGREGEYITRTSDYAVMLSINVYVEMFGSGHAVQSPITCSVLLPEGITIARFEIPPNDPGYAKAREVYDAAALHAVKRTQSLTEFTTQLARSVG